MHSAWPQLQFVSVPPAAFLQCVLQNLSSDGAGHLHGVWAHVSVDCSLFIYPLHFPENRYGNLRCQLLNWAMGE